MVVMLTLVKKSCVLKYLAPGLTFCYHADVSTDVI